MNKNKPFIVPVVLYCFLVLAAGSWLSGCKPEVVGKDLAAAPADSDVKFSATPDATNPNIIHFKNLSEGVISSSWDLGNGGTAITRDADGAYAVEGEYVVKLTIFTAGGYASSSQTVQIAETNVAMLNRSDYNFLTGGAANLNGKVWVIDKDTIGHLGVGPAGSSFPEYYQAGPNEKASEGFYDDEMTFNLNGFKYTYDNKGGTFVNGANAAGLGGVTGADYTQPYTPSSNLNWAITEEGGKNYLSITGNGFISYYTGVSKYEILTLDENHIFLKAGDKASPDLAWFLRLVPKGYTRPVKEKPLKAVDLADNFGAEATANWIFESMELTRIYDNPSPLTNPVKVGMYNRLPGDANQYANMQLKLDYRMDLSTRNKFRVKVFAPSYNDYSNGKLLPQLSVKLQNSLDGGNAWQTQTERIQQIIPQNEWVTLEFDFSAIAAETKYDQIVVQFGGEGHPFPGIFFIESFELE